MDARDEVTDVAVSPGGRSRRPELIRARVHLVEREPEIWRLFEIDADARLDEVHEVLQVVMGWEDSHLHTFDDVDPYEAGLRRIGPAARRWGSEFLREEDEDMLPEEEFSLRDVLSEDGPLFYTYDLGDQWIHRIVLIETIRRESSDPFARVVRGELRCPLEDSGGVGGYEELLAALKDPTDDRHLEFTEWVAEFGGDEGHPFDETEFDADAVNAGLLKLFPTR